MLESSRLILKPISLEYKSEVFQEFTSEITTYMYPLPADDLRKTQKVIADMIQRIKNKTDLILVILNKDNFEFLGLCGIHNIDTSTPELGIWTKKSAHGNGFGREAIHLLKDWVDKNLEYEYLSYPVDKRNIASRKIPESLGGQVVREFHQTNMSGNLLDEVEYRIYRIYK